MASETSILNFPRQLMTTLGFTAYMGFIWGLGLGLGSHRCRGKYMLSCVRTWLILSWLQPFWQPVLKKKAFLINPEHAEKYVSMCILFTCSFLCMFFYAKDSHMKGKKVSIKRPLHRCLEKMNMFRKARAY